MINKQRQQIYGVTADQMPASEAAKAEFAKIKADREKGIYNYDLERKVGYSEEKAEELGLEPEIPKPRPKTKEELEREKRDAEGYAGAWEVVDEAAMYSENYRADDVVMQTDEEKASVCAPSLLPLSSPPLTSSGISPCPCKEA